MENHTRRLITKKETALKGLLRENHKSLSPLNIPGEGTLSRESDFVNFSPQSFLGHETATGERRQKSTPIKETILTKRSGPT